MNASQVSSPFEQVRRRAVAQPVRAEIRGARARRRAAGAPPSAPCAGRRGRRGRPSSSAGPLAWVAHAGRPADEPRLERCLGGRAVRHGPLAIALAQDASNPAPRSRSSTSRPHSSPTRIPVAYRSSSTSRSRRSTVASPLTCSSRWVASSGASTSGSGRWPRGDGEQRAGVSAEQTAPVRPRREDPSRRSAASHGGASYSGAAQPGQPATQHDEVEVLRVGGAHAGGVLEQQRDITAVGPNRVDRTSTLELEVARGTPPRRRPAPAAAARGRPAEQRGGRG